MIIKLEDKLAYIIAVVSEFVATFKLNPQQAYRYLDRFKGIDFVDKFYNAETYTKVLDLRTGLYSQSTAYVYSILETEILTGKLG